MHIPIGLAKVYGECASRYFVKYECGQHAMAGTATLTIHIADTECS